MTAVACGGGGGGAATPAPGGGGGGGGGGAPAEPAAPTGLTVNTVGKTFILRWNAVAGAASYNVYLSAAANVETTAGNRNKQGLTGTTARIEGGLNSKAYFVVTAVAGTGASTTEGKKSNEVSATAIEYANARPADPHYGKQWYHDSNGLIFAVLPGTNGTAGENTKVEKVWAKHIDGNGVRVVVVDDGMELAHEDLAANIVAGASYNFADQSNDPTPTGPTEANAHGQSCAGIIGAVRDNGKGISGVAPRVGLAGYNLIVTDAQGNSSLVNTANKVTAMSRNIADVWVFNNSWGSPDSSGAVQPAEQAFLDAIEAGLSKGRNGLGAIYMWAAGNGHYTTTPAGAPTKISVPVDNANLDEGVNFHGVMTIGAVNALGTKAGYSEEGSCLLVCAPSGGGEFTYTGTGVVNDAPITGLVPSIGMLTTDRSGELGSNKAGAGDSGFYGAEIDDRNYTAHFNGTSAATPVATGVVALILNANPNLTWRDVRWILAHSARKNDANDAGWIQNKATPPEDWNIKYGFGVVDADAAITMATTNYTNLPTMKTVSSEVKAVGTAIPESETGISSTVSLTGSGITKLEYVNIVFSAAHGSANDLAVQITSPSGTKVLIATPHNRHTATPPFTNHDFGITTFMGEPADGEWKIDVTDGVPGDNGTFTSWQVRAYGH